MSKQNSVGLDEIDGELDGLRELVGGDDGECDGELDGMKEPEGIADLVGMFDGDVEVVLTF